MISNGCSRIHRILTDEERFRGYKTRWTELEVHGLFLNYFYVKLLLLGRIKNISSAIFEMRHLTALFLGNNQLQLIPSGISQLCNLTLLDLSHNKLRNLPKEIGDMVRIFVFI